MLIYSCYILEDKICSTWNIFFKILFMKISGYLVDIHSREIYPAEIDISGRTIGSIKRIKDAPEVYILPGLIDSHIHIESSMVTPGAFGYEAVRHGTVGVVSDPHEIANVLGIKGVEFMIEDSLKSPVKFWFGAPSCVPATLFETSGGILTVEDTIRLLERKDIKYLSEMMNFPGVIFNDIEVIDKIRAARRLGKPVDGHAPGITGEDLRKYIESGITTDHECSTLQEAEEKISLGVKVLIREGSAARNLDSLKDLFNTNPEMVMLCSDDLHPEMFVEGHINKLIGRLVTEGFDLFDVIRSATINPVNHYNLDSGLLKVGQKADFIIVRKLDKMDISETWIDGEKVFADGKRSFYYNPGDPVNHFNCTPVQENDFVVRSKPGMIRIIEAFNGELITREIRLPVPAGDYVNTDPENDILKIVVKERYQDSPAVTGFIKGFGLKNGAIASSIAHDSHNIVCVGTNDGDIANAINEIIKLKGGLAVSVNGKRSSMQLNIGGIMSTRSCVEVAQEYSILNNLAASFGCSLAAPFMTLSFMALLVIPDLKIGDKGLFDVKKFRPVSLFVEPGSKD
jgi:adenine deaminase